MDFGVNLDRLNNRNFKFGFCQSSGTDYTMLRPDGVPFVSHKSKKPKIFRILVMNLCCNAWSRFNILKNSSQSRHQNGERLNLLAIIQKNHDLMESLSIYYSFIGDFYQWIGFDKKFAHCQRLESCTVRLT